MQSIVFSKYVILSIFETQVWCHLINLGPVQGPKAWDDDFEDRIVGGKPTSLKKFPWNVIIVNYGGVCGGTILTEKTVLTAAHCFDDNVRTEEMIVFANSRYLYDPKSIRYRVWDFKMHERYNDPIKFSNDIAVIMVHNVFHYSDTVQRAFLCNSYVWKNETKPVFVASGWGEIGYKEKMSPQGLLTTNLSLVSRERCMEMNKAQISPDMFCLYGDGQRDTCRGDSGGAVLWNGMVVGIVSHAKACAKTPGVYNDVLYQMSWIRSTVESLYRTQCFLYKMITE